MKIKTLALSIALTLGTANAHAFFNQTVEPEMGSASSDEFMNEKVEPVPSPVAGSSSDAEDINDQIRKEAEEKARNAEIERERIKKEIEEKARQEQMEKEKLQREIREKAEAEARAKAEAERKARLAKQKAEREQAERNRDELIDMRNRVSSFVDGLDLTQYPDRLKYKEYHDKAVKLAGGDASNEHVQAIKTKGGQSYYLTALSHLQEHGKYLFSSAQNAKETGIYLLGPATFNRPGVASLYGFDYPDTKAGQFVEIVETWADRIDEAESYLGFARKYGTDRQKSGAEFSRLQEHFDSRKSDIPALKEKRDQILAMENYDPEMKVGGSANLGDVLGKVGEVGGKAIDKGAEIGSKAWSGIKSLWN